MFEDRRVEEVRRVVPEFAKGARLFLRDDRRQLKRIAEHHDADAAERLARVRAYDRSALEITGSKRSEPRVPFEVELLHQDDHLVAVDKPHFLSVTPTGRYLQETVLVRLKRQLGLDTLVPMHRLDRETAGVLLFTVQPGSRHAYQSLLRDHRVHKIYEAIAPWRADLALPLTVRSRLEERPGEAFMQMAAVAGEPNAETRIELIERLPQLTNDAAPTPPDEGWARYRLTPLTGRKHQLRAQMSALGLPIAGDRIYPRLWPEPAPGAAPDYREPLQLLAREFAFTDPLDGRPRRFVSRRRLLGSGG